MAGLLVGMKGPVDTSAYFYQLLHAMGVFPPTASPTVRAVSGRAQGQISVEQMIDRYQIACRPVRDLLVDYLRERQLSVDYTSLRVLAFGLSKLFWKDLEGHHPGIDSLRPDSSAASTSGCRVVGLAPARRDATQPQRVKSSMIPPLLRGARSGNS
jgi:hypothetical protein